MKKELFDLKDYKYFVDDIMENEKYYDPFLLDDEGEYYFYNPRNLNNKRFIGIYDDNKIIGIFVLYILTDEKYIEITHAISSSEIAYKELFQLLDKEYNDYSIDLVFNPKNDYMMRKLKERKAIFDKEQQKMVLNVPCYYKGKHNIVLYSDEYKKDYISIHDDGLYWTAEKVLNSLDKFRVILCVKDNKVVGYVDITYTDEVNIPFDVYVKEEYRGLGVAKEMLSYAIELNGNKGMKLDVDVDNVPAIKAYKSLGFVKVNGNTITAHIEK